MPFQTKKIQIVNAKLEPKLGVLAKIYRGFSEAKVNVTASWGYEMGPSEANAHFYATDVKKAQDVLTKMGLKPELSWAVWVEGSDQVGAYADVLTKVEKAGVNIHATDAISVGGKFATVIFADDKDVDKMNKALGG